MIDISLQSNVSLECISFHKLANYCSPELVDNLALRRENIYIYDRTSYCEVSRWQRQNTEYRKMKLAKINVSGSCSKVWEDDNH